MCLMLARRWHEAILYWVWRWLCFESRGRKMFYLRSWVPWLYLRSRYLLILLDALKIIPNWGSNFEFFQFFKYIRCLWPLQTRLVLLWRMWSMLRNWEFFHIRSWTYYRRTWRVCNLYWLFGRWSSLCWTMLPMYTRMYYLLYKLDFMGLENSTTLGALFKWDYGKLFWKLFWGKSEWVWARLVGSSQVYSWVLGLK